MKHINSWYMDFNHRSIVGDKHKKFYLNIAEGTKSLFYLIKSLQ